MKQTENPIHRTQRTAHQHVVPVVLGFHLTPQFIHNLLITSLFFLALTGLKHTLKHAAAQDSFICSIIIATGMRKSKRIYPYREARLKTYTNDLSKRWNVEYWAWSEEKGKLVRRQEWVPSHFKTASERRAYAKAVIRQVNDQLQNGYCFTSQTAHQKMKLSEAVKTYLDYKLPKLKKKTDYTSVFNQMFMPYMDECHPNILLSNVTKPILIAWLDHMQRHREWMPRTYNQKKSFVYNFFEYFTMREVLDNNPMKGIPQQKPGQEAKFLPFQYHETEYLRREMERQDPELLLYTQFIYYCFLRPNEVRRLKLSDIDIHNKKIRVRKEISKNSKTQYVQIPSALVDAILKSGRMNSPAHFYFFGKDKKPNDKHYGYNTMSKRNRLFLNKKGYSIHHSLYSWKHTGCCALYRLTKDLKLVSTQCRHYSTQVTDLYLRDLGMYTDNQELDGFV